MYWRTKLIVLADILLFFWARATFNRYLIIPAMLVQGIIFGLALVAAWRLDRREG